MILRDRRCSNSHGASTRCRSGRRTSHANQSRRIRQAVSALATITTDARRGLRFSPTGPWCTAVTRPRISAGPASATVFPRVSITAVLTCCTSDESGWKRKDGSTMGVLEYTLIVAGTAYYRGFQVGRKHPRVQRNFLLYSSVTFAGVALLCWYRPVPALFVFLLPMMISLLFTVWVTFDHHSGLETDDAFHASYNNTNRLFNFLTGNLGYHTAHHYRLGLHWSKLPGLHESIKHLIPSRMMRDSRFVLGNTS